MIQEKVEGQSRKQRYHSLRCMILLCMMFNRVFHDTRKRTHTALNWATDCTMKPCMPLTSGDVYSRLLSMLHWTTVWLTSGSLINSITNLDKYMPFVFSLFFLFLVKSFSLCILLLLPFVVNKAYHHNQLRLHNGKIGNGVVQCRPHVCFNIDIGLHYLHTCMFDV